MLDNILLVGTGYMGNEYAKVLKGMKIHFIAVGRGETHAKAFESTYDTPVIRGGLDAWLKTDPALPHYAIIATNEDQLAPAAIALMERGLNNLLIEKPGGLTAQDVKKVGDKARETNTAAYIGYNRRFYASTQTAKKLLTEDGGVLSFNFEFTEWVHKISEAQKQSEVGRNWFLANSTHVIDLAFFLGGKPKTLTAFTAGGLAWHPAASIYAGAGVSETGALFNYQANWGAPGRWSVEIITSAHRYIFRPLEKLAVQKIGSVAIDDIAIDDALDVQYKPGLWREVESFLGDTTHLPDIHEQVRALSWYKKINGADHL
ncbi:MAG: Gfo/Idh/MocA family oxidoreductase [Patescibacteria group bacterium]